MDILFGGYFESWFICAHVVVVVVYPLPPCTMGQVRCPRSIGDQPCGCPGGQHGCHSNGINPQM